MELRSALWHKLLPKSLFPLEKPCSAPGPSSSCPLLGTATCTMPSHCSQVLPGATSPALQIPAARDKEERESLGKSVPYRDASVQRVLSDFPTPPCCVCILMLPDTQHPTTQNHSGSAWPSSILRIFWFMDFELSSVRAVKTGLVVRNCYLRGENEIHCPEPELSNDFRNLSPLKCCVEVGPFPGPGACPTSGFQVVQLW